MRAGDRNSLRVLKLTNVRSIILASLLTCLIAIPLFSAGMDANSRNLLITKFQKVLVGLAPSDPAYTAVSLRLADLLSERARLDAMSELEHGCIECNAGIKDRKAALKLYESSVAKVPEESQGKIIFQVGHLNEILGQRQKAEAVYLDIIRKNQSHSLVAEARAALGELYFKQRRFGPAREQFEIARKDGLGQQGLAAYRIAVCLAHEGKLSEAANELRQLLKSPKMLTRNGAVGVVSVDKQFQDEVARELATYYGKLNPTQSEISELYELSSDSARLDNVEFLATELERMGAREKSIQAWQFSLNKQTQPRKRLEGLVRLSQLYMEAGQAEHASKEYERALALWSQVQCDQSCAELKSRLRKFAIDWNRLSKKSLTAEVLQAYESYLAVFTDDTEMMFWGAQVARELKDYSKSMSLFQSFVETSTPKSKTVQGKEKQDIETNIENALLSQIEVAELSKDITTQALAYNRYLQFSPKGKKRVEVQYQQAHLIYKQEKYDEASNALRSVALLPTKDSESIRIQAAELSLDALAILKDDVRLEAWSKEFANKFSGKRLEFLSVARKSVLNQSAKAVSTTGKGDVNTAWSVLARTDLTGAEDKDKIIYFKNKLILAEKLGKYAEARNAVDSLLRVPGLSAEDQEFALARRSWFAELALDFSTAYSANQKMKLSELKPDEKTLRLAMFAELANQNPRAYYEDYIRTTSNKENARLVAARLVREAKSPLSEIKKYERVLSEDAPLLAQLYLEAYAQSKDIKIISSVVKNKALVQTPAGKEFLRMGLLAEIQPIGSELGNLSIGVNKQSEISKGIKKRVAVISKLESVVAKTVESSDWMSQVVGLSILGREIERFYNEIIALPVPAGLTPEEEGQYLQLLSQQASPYQVKAADIKAKLQEFWSGGQTQKVIADFSELTGDLRSLYAFQLKELQGYAPDSDKALIASALSQAEPGAKNMPTVAEIEAARRLVRDNPMSPDQLIKLSKLEKQMGRTTMASYLEARAQKSIPSGGDSK